MERLSPYDFTGILVPGATVVFAILLCIDQVKLASALESVSVGGLGLFGVLAYVVGHVVQAFGNLVEWAWWFRRGLPTSWLRHGKPALWNAHQHERIIAALIHFGIVPDRDSLQSLTKSAWRGTTAEVYARVAAAGRAGRVDVFNGNFGLHRGVAAGLLLATGVALHAKSELVWLFLPAAGLAAARMERFARHYARELYIQFLCSIEPSAPSTLDPAVNPAP
jgi:hypothetical protein